MGKYNYERDIYYRKAKELGYRARSAFKLLHVDEECDIFEGVTRAVDLCSAPGSWSQVLAQRLNQTIIPNKNITDHETHRLNLITEQKVITKKEENISKQLGKEADKIFNACIVSVDLQEMAPIRGVHIIQGDITEEKVMQKILSYFPQEKKAQLVVCDGAPDVTGTTEIDEYVQAQLLHAALDVCRVVLSDGGTFVTKIFKGECYGLLLQQLQLSFDWVTCIKPMSSRARSAEHFAVGKGFHHLLGSTLHSENLLTTTTIVTTTMTSTTTTTSMANPTNTLTTTAALIRPFLACGDFSPFNQYVHKISEQIPIRSYDKFLHKK